MKITQEVDLVNTILNPLNNDLIISADRTKRKFQTDQVNINVTPSDIDLLNNLLEQKQTNTTIPMVVVAKQPTIENILIDSGSLKSNYIDISLFDRLKAQGMPTKRLPKRKRVCSGLAGGEGQEIDEYMDVLLVFIDELTNKEKSILIQVHPVQLRDSSFSIIIGLPAIQQHRLASKFPSVFEEKKSIII